MKVTVIGIKILFFMIVELVALTPTMAIADPASTYADVIQPIFTDNCVACHQTTSAPDGLNLEEGKSFAHLVGKRSAHAPMILVQPKAPDRSYLIAKLENTHLISGGAGERMPLGGTLSPKDIAAIRQWISTGAKP